MGRKRATSKATTVGNALKKNGQQPLVKAMALIIEDRYMPVLKGPAHVECLGRVKDDWGARLLWVAYYSVPNIDVNRRPYLSEHFRCQREYGKLLWECLRLIRVLWDGRPTYRKLYPEGNPIVVWQNVALELFNRDKRIATKKQSKRPIEDERGRWAALIRCIENKTLDDRAVKAFGEGADLTHFFRMLRETEKVRKTLRGRRLEVFDSEGFLLFCEQVEVLQSSSLKRVEACQSTDDGTAVLQGRPQSAIAKPVSASPFAFEESSDSEVLTSVLYRVEIDERKNSAQWYIAQILKKGEFEDQLVFSN